MSSKSKPEAPHNSAAYLTGPKARPLKVSSAPYTPPAADEVVIRNRAVAINPVDRMKQEMGDMLYGWVKYPIVQGIDCAGEIVEVGSSITRLQVGDRVLGGATGMEKEINKSSHGGFQLYPVVQEQTVVKIPDSMTFEAAATLPLGFVTATAGLFQPDQLALQKPKMKVQKTGHTLLVWGASTSVGCNAVQLGVAAGCEVVAVCGSKNFDLAKRLGASQVYDYKSPTVIADLAAAFKGKTSASCISCGNGGPEACLEAFKGVKGPKTVAFAAFPLPNPMPTTFVIPRFVWHMTKWFTWWAFWSTLRGVKRTSIWGGSPAFNGLAKEVMVGYLQEALAEGKYVTAPQPKIVGHGLESIQEAYDELGRGVSATKLIVTL